MVKIPGAPIIHAVITPNCRTVERPDLDEDPRMAAFEEAVNRAREKYRNHLEACDPDLLDRQNLRLVLLAETPGRMGADITDDTQHEAPARDPMTLLEAIATDESLRFDVRISWDPEDGFWLSEVPRRRHSRAIVIDGRHGSLREAITAAAEALDIAPPEHDGEGARTSWECRNCGWAGGCMELVRSADGLSPTCPLCAGEDLWEPEDWTEQVKAILGRTPPGRDGERGRDPVAWRVRYRRIGRDWAWFRLHADRDKAVQDAEHLIQNYRSISYAEAVPLYTERSEVQGESGPTPETLREWAGWFEDPNRSPAVKCPGTHGEATPGLMLRQIASELEKTRAALDATPEEEDGDD